MRNVLVIMKRELRALYTSPIGYMFMIVFLAVSVSLYITTFFTFPMADMRGYFANLPVILCVFIPAVTMRVWAEERKENTWEMLLTFPMRASELVIGKFLATLVFFTATLAGTLTIPIMLMVLGSPDLGAIFTGYIGTILLGAMFLSIGIFFSGFFKDQIVAFVVTLLACFTLFLLGTNLIAGYIDGFFGEESMFAGLGSLLGRLLGVLGHYDAFTRGIVELGDVVYFLAWTGVFLFLNIQYVGERHRPKARQNYAIAITLCVFIGLAFNWLVAGASLGRFDFTEDKIYTVSDASKSILGRLPDQVQVRYYVSRRNQMPTEFNTLEEDVTAKLEELRVASGGKIQYGVVHLEAAKYLEAIQTHTQTDPFGMPLNDDEPEEELTEAKILEERMLEKGIEPFPVQAVADDTVTSKLIYSHIGIAYRDHPEEIIPAVTPRMMPELEYHIVSTVFKMSLERQPIVAMVAPKESILIPAEQRRIFEQLGQPIPESQDPYTMAERLLRSEKYDVRRVELTQDSPLPAEYDTLVVINPRELNDRQLWEINRALVSGKSVFLAAQHYEWDYRIANRRLNMSVRNQTPNVNRILEAWGLEVDERVLMDPNNIQLNISSGDALQDMLAGGQPVSSATHMLITNNTMDNETSITSRLSTLFYLWGTPLRFDADKIAALGLEKRELIHTSASAWTAELTSEIGMRLQDPGDSPTAAYPIMAMISGQFPDAFADEERPAWPMPQPTPGQPMPAPPAEEAPAAPIAPAPGKLIVLGGASMFRDDFVQNRSFRGNAELLLNSVDALSLSDDIVHVRGRKPIDRLIERPSDEARAFWRFVNFALVNMIVAGAGITVAAARVRGRNAYTMSFYKKKDA